jgi:hypothetical protein
MPTVPSAEVRGQTIDRCCCQQLKFTRPRRE